MPGTVCHKINIQCVTIDLLEHAGFLFKCVACVGLRLLHMQDVVVVIINVWKMYAMKPNVQYYIGPLLK